MSVNLIPPRSEQCYITSRADSAKRLNCHNLSQKPRFGSGKTTKSRRPYLLWAAIAGLFVTQAAQFQMAGSNRQDNTQTVAGLRQQVAALTESQRALRADQKAMRDEVGRLALQYLETMAQDGAKTAVTFRIFNEKDKSPVSTASGGVISAGGHTYVLINAHSISDLPELQKEASHGIYLAPVGEDPDEPKFKATIVKLPVKAGESPQDAADPARDLALLEIVPDHSKAFNALVKPAPLYPLDKALPYGGLLHLYGAPFKQYGSVTLGVLANREVLQYNDYGMPVIYTDAKSNRGSSGGFAIYAKTGEMVGMQVMINLKDPGMTYLIPIRHIKGWLQYECDKPVLTEAEKQAYPREAYEKDKQEFATWARARAAFDQKQAAEAKAQEETEKRDSEANAAFIRSLKQGLDDLQKLRTEVDALKQAGAKSR